ncbi:hypothetical protein N7527_009549 [Penicillium freii]|nr:hypothetical protein N7527_009549 [Penicillium freii]
MPTTAMAQASDPSKMIGPLSSFELGAVNSRPCDKMCKLLGRPVNDPYHEFIPAMLERYNIDADWRQYTLSVVCGDEVQDVRFNEQPLLLCKRLQELGQSVFIPQHGLDDFTYSGGSTPISNKQECKGHTVFETSAEYYRSMKRFLPNLGQAGIPASDSREKLAKLSSHQLSELTMAVSPLLEVQEEPHERRNEARSKLRALEYHQLEYITSNVVLLDELFGSGSMAVEDEVLKCRIEREIGLLALLGEDSDSSEKTSEKLEHLDHRERAELPKSASS